MNGKTKSGLRVIGLVNVPCNSAGHKVTFPIKGSIVLREKPLKLKFNIWTEKGETDPVWHRNCDLDLDMESIR